MDLAAAPYHIPAREALYEWTLPQVLFAWMSRQEEQAAEARQMFQLTMLAIGATFAKDGSKIANTVIDALDGGRMTEEDLIEELSEQAQLVLFGSKRLGRKRDPDTAQD